MTNVVSDHDAIVFVTIHPEGLIMQFNVNKLITGQQPRLHHTRDNPARFIWTVKLICASSLYFGLLLLQVQLHNRIQNSFDTFYSK